MQAAPPPAPKADLALWRLDCGDFVIKDYNSFFSDTFAYRPGPKAITSSCYLIKHGNRYMLWDTGIDGRDQGQAGRQSRPVDRGSSKTIVEQLAHARRPPGPDRDHRHQPFSRRPYRPGGELPQGRAGHGRGRLAALRAKPPHAALKPELLKPWLTGGGKLVEAQGDIDIFDDGSVTMLSLPGHTPGHSALLVRLASGPVLLSGDLYHFTRAGADRGRAAVQHQPRRHARVDGPVRQDRENLRAKVIIQHEPADIAKLPRFPDAAR